MSNQTFNAGFYIGLAEKQKQTIYNGNILMKYNPPCNAVPTGAMFNSATGFYYVNGKKFKYKDGVMSDVSAYTPLDMDSDSEINNNHTVTHYTSYVASGHNISIKAYLSYDYTNNKIIFSEYIGDAVSRKVYLAISAFTSQELEEFKSAYPTLKQTVDYVMIYFHTSKRVLVLYLTKTDIRQIPASVFNNYDPAIKSLCSNNPIVSVYLVADDKYVDYLVKADSSMQELRRYDSNTSIDITGSFSASNHKMYDAFYISDKTCMHTSQPYIRLAGDSRVQFNGNYFNVNDMQYNMSTNKVYLCDLYVVAIIDDTTITGSPLKILRIFDSYTGSIYWEQELKINSNVFEVLYGIANNVLFTDRSIYDIEKKIVYDYAGGVY